MKIPYATTLSHINQCNADKNFRKKIGDADKNTARSKYFSIYHCFEC